MQTTVITIRGRKGVCPPKEAPNEAQLVRSRSGEGLALASKLHRKKAPVIQEGTSKKRRRDKVGAGRHEPQDSQ